MSWRALGASWTVEFANSYESTVVAERLCASAQVVLAELAPHDPALLPTEVHFSVEVAPDDTEVEMESQSDGRGTRWRIKLPALGSRDPEAFRKIGQETLLVVMSAVADIATLPQSEMSELLDQMVEAGLLDKLGFGSVYDVAYEDLISSEVFGEVDRSELVPLLPRAPAEARQADDMTPSGPGPHYDAATSEKLVAGRYERVPETLVATLPALRDHEPFQGVVSDLRTSGWKDWHILLAILQVAQNSRIQLRRPPASEAEARELYQRFMAPEAQDDPADLALFTSDDLRDAIKVSWGSTLKLWGLELNQNPPDMDALETLLSDRYGYWADDVPHDDPFVG